MARLNTFLIALIIGVAFPYAAVGCSCVVLDGACAKVWNAGEVVFLGKVTAMVAREEFHGKVLMSRAAHFLVKEDFRGMKGQEKEVIVLTGSGMGDCGYPFVVGTSYVVYARPFAGYLTTETCSETAPEVVMAATLKELRSVHSRGRSDDLFGTILLHPVGNGWEDLPKAKPLEHVTVEAIGSGRRRFSATTDAQGTYAFSSLPADQYRIRVEWPAGFERYGDAGQKQPRIPIDKRKGQGAGCRQDEFARSLR